MTVSAASETINVLLIEDNPADAALVRYALTEVSGVYFEFERMERLSSAMEYLSKKEIDIVLLDLTLPDSQGLETFTQLHSRFPALPVVVLTGLDDQNLALETLRNGAQDYIVKKDVNGPTLTRIMRYAIERRKLQQMKDEFVGAVSHEMRTPMTIMREGVSQILEGLRGEVAEDQKKILSISLNAMDRLKRILDELMEISKIEAGKTTLEKEYFDIVEAVREVKSSFSARAQAKGIELRESYSHPSIHICADRDKVIQVFTNLIGNALKFTSQGYIEISVQDQEHAVEAAVSDTGRGIAPENMPKLFTKFQQFDRAPGPGEKGTGLGLSICKGIIDLHLGRIWAESELGKGSRFSFSLPKQSARDVFESYVEKGIREAMRKGMPLSIIVFDIKNYDLVKAKLGSDKAASISASLEGLIMKNLRKYEDTSALGLNPHLTLLQGTAKAEALAVSRRIKRNFDEQWAEADLPVLIEISAEVSSYPEDGNRAADLIQKALSSRPLSSF